MSHHQKLPETGGYGDEFSVRAEGNCVDAAVELANDLRRVGGVVDVVEQEKAVGGSEKKRFFLHEVVEGGNDVSGFEIDGNSIGGGERGVRAPNGVFVERGEMGSVNEIVGREEEDAVAFDVEAAKPYSFLVRVKGESQGNLPRR